MNYAKEIKELKARVEKLENSGKHEKIFTSCDIETVLPSKTQKSFEQPTEKKITLDEFWDSDEPLAIYCETWEQSEELCKAFDRMGKKLVNGKSYLCENFGDYEKNICYTNKNTWYDNDGYFKGKIYNFEDVIFPEEPKHVIKEEPKWNFTEDEKVILKNVSKEYRWITRDKDGELHLYTSKPKKYRTFWGYVGDCNDSFCFDSIFKCIKWEDDEPCEFRRYL